MPDSPWTTWAPGTRVVVRRRLSPDDAAAAGKPLTDVIGVGVDTTARARGLQRSAARAEPRFFAMLAQKLARKKAGQIRAGRARLFGHGTERGVEPCGAVRRVGCT